MASPLPGFSVLVLPLVLLDEATVLLSTQKKVQPLSVAAPEAAPADRPPLPPAVLQPAPAYQPPRAVPALALAAMVVLPLVCRFRLRLQLVVEEEVEDLVLSVVPAVVAAPPMVLSAALAEAAAPPMLAAAPLAEAAPRAVVEPPC